MKIVGRIYYFFDILFFQENESLRANLTLAIAYCSEWGENNYKFGQLNAVAPLVNYMTSRNKDILRGVCIAAYHLSKEPSNCITMHSSGVIQVQLYLSTLQQLTKIFYIVRDISNNSNNL